RAFERRGLVGRELELRRRGVGQRGGGGGDRGLRRGRVHRPRVGGGGGVGVARAVGGAHPEGVLALGEILVGAAGAEVGAVERAFERRGLVGRERERRGGAVRRVRGRRVDRRLGRGGVDRPRVHPGRRGGAPVPVGGPDAEGVLALGQVGVRAARAVLAAVERALERRGL